MASWKKVIVSGSQAHLAAVTASSLTDNRLVYSDDGGILLSSDVQVNDNGHLEGTFSGSHEFALTNGNGIETFSYDGGAADTVEIKLSGSTLTVDGDGVAVNAAGITEVEISSSAAGDGLTGGDGTPISVDLSGSTLTVSDEGLAVAEDGITTTEIADESIIFDHLSGSAVITESEGIADNDTDEALPTAAAVKDYVDAQIAGGTLTVSGSGGTNNTVDLTTEDLIFAGESGVISTSASLASGDVTFTTAIVDGGIGFAKLAGGAVSGSAIADAGIGNAKLVNDEITFGADNGTDVEVELGSAIDIVGGTNISTTIDTNGNITASLDDRITITDATGSFTGSFTGDGSGLTGLVTNLSISSSANNDVDAATDSIDLRTEGLLFAGTENEVKVEAAATLQGNTVTIGLPENVTIQGDLTVLGTRTQLNVEDLVVEDRFIYLASGSSGATDGGIIVEGAADNDGKGFGWDNSYVNGESNAVGRWGFDNAMVSGSDTISPSAYAAAVVTNDSDATYRAVGNIRIDTATEDIYIYS